MKNVNKNVKAMGLAVSKTVKEGVEENLNSTESIKEFATKVGKGAVKLMIIGGIYVTIEHLKDQSRAVMTDVKSDNNQFMKTFMRRYTDELNDL